MNLSRVRIERPPVASRNNNSLSGKYKNRVALVEISSTQQLFSMNSLFTHIRNYNSNYIFPIFFMISTAFARNFARKKSQQNCQATQNNNIHIVWKIQKKVTLVKVFSTYFRIKNNTIIKCYVCFYACVHSLKFYLLSFSPHNTGSKPLWACSSLNKCMNHTVHKE